ncbi:MAG TPA: divalent-cation tolerance protein CutA [Terriglobia bacterium]|nr:divalent-cation tolerance protein CutA [Terriglobia bacterium]
MTDYIIVLVTCESPAEAERIAESVVAEKLAACVNVLPGIRSCFVWEGSQNWSSEVLLFIKTTRARFDALKERVIALHSYTTPEIVATPIVAGLESYLGWIRESVGDGADPRSGGETPAS